MSKHTLGPWVACFETFCGVKRAFHIAGKPHGSARPIASFSNDDWRGVDVPEEVIEANARLIAAAPEMLEALKDCYELIAAEFCSDEASAMQGHPIDKSARKAWDKVCVAIAKAEGRS